MSNESFLSRLFGRQRVSPGVTPTADESVEVGHDASNSDENRPENSDDFIVLGQTSSTLATSLTPSGDDPPSYDDILVGSGMPPNYRPNYEHSDSLTEGTLRHYFRDIPFRLSVPLELARAIEAGCGDSLLAELLSIREKSVNWSDYRYDFTLERSVADAPYLSFDSNSVDFVDDSTVTAEDLAAIAAADGIDVVDGATLAAIAAADSIDGAAAAGITAAIADTAAAAADIIDMTDLADDSMAAAEEPTGTAADDGGADGATATAADDESAIIADETAAATDEIADETADESAAAVADLIDMTDSNDDVEVMIVDEPAEEAAPNNGGDDDVQIIENT